MSGARYVSRMCAGEVGDDRMPTRAVDALLALGR